MIAVRMVQASIDQIIHMVAMRNRRVTASWAMLMRRIVSAGGVLRRTVVRIRGSDFDHMFSCFFDRGISAEPTYFNETRIFQFRPELDRHWDPLPQNCGAEV